MNDNTQSENGPIHFTDSLAQSADPENTGDYLDPHDPVIKVKSEIPLETGGPRIQPPNYSITSPDNENARLDKVAQKGNAPGWVQRILGLPSKF